jgi:hypothetical protein
VLVLVRELLMSEFVWDVQVKGFRARVCCGFLDSIFDGVSLPTTSRKIHSGRVFRLRNIRSIQHCQQDLWYRFAYFESYDSQILKVMTFLLNINAIFFSNKAKVYLQS